MIRGGERRCDCTRCKGDPEYDAFTDGYKQGTDRERERAVGLVDKLCMTGSSLACNCYVCQVVKKIRGGEG